jgi:hypothetical protein
MNIRLKGANLILVKVEKMTCGARGASAAAAVLPAHDRNQHDLPAQCKTGRGSRKERAEEKPCSDLVPQAIIARPKSGMMVPVRFWFQGDMRRYGQKLAVSPANSSAAALFNPDYVERLLNYEMEGVPGLRHGLKLWMLVTFLLWHEQMVETPLPAHRAAKRESDHRHGAVDHRMIIVAGSEIAVGVPGDHIQRPLLGEKGMQATGWYIPTHTRRAADTRRRACGIRRFRA